MAQNDKITIWRKVESALVKRIADAQKKVDNINLPTETRNKAKIKIEGLNLELTNARVMVKHYESQDDSKIKVGNESAIETLKLTSGLSYTASNVIYVMAQVQALTDLIKSLNDIKTTITNGLGEEEAKVLDDLIKKVSKATK